MKNLAPFAMWVLTSLLLAGLSWLAWHKYAYSFVLVFGVLAIIAAIFAWDELHIFNRERRKPQIVPPTKIPDFPPQTKRSVR